MRATAKEETAQPVRLIETENDRAYCGSTGEITVKPRITKADTTDRFIIKKRRFFMLV